MKFLKHKSYFEYTTIYSQYTNLIFTLHCNRPLKSRKNDTYRQAQEIIFFNIVSFSSKVHPGFTITTITPNTLFYFHTTL